MHTPEADGPDHKKIGEGGAEPEGIVKKEAPEETLLDGVRKKVASQLDENGQALEGAKRFLEGLIDSQKDVPPKVIGYLATSPDVEDYYFTTEMVLGPKIEAHEGWKSATVHTNDVHEANGIHFRCGFKNTYLGGTKIASLLSFFRSTGDVDTYKLNVGNEAIMKEVSKAAYDHFLEFLRAKIAEGIIEDQRKKRMVA